MIIAAPQRRQMNVGFNAAPSSSTSVCLVPVWMSLGEIMVASSSRDRQRLALRPPLARRP